MFKIIALALGAILGFAGGVYWSAHNPQNAQQLSAEEERRFLEAQVQITQKIQAKLDQLSSKTTTPTGSGFLPARKSEPTPAVAEDVNELKADTRKQQEDLRKRIDQLK